jgi:hypothetical protein
MVLSGPPCFAAEPQEDDLAGMEGQFELFADARLRGDFVRDLPRPVNSDFDRGSVRLRAGVLWMPHPAVDIGLAGRVNTGTDGNGHTRFNLDNQKVDEIALDEFFVTVRLLDSTELLAGQSRFPLQLTPMLWDPDLRPQGVSLRQRFEFATFNSVELTGGYFLGNHLYGDESKVRAAQATLRIGEGKAVNYRAAVSWIEFGDLDTLAREGLGRTNAVVPGDGYANDFDLLDIQLEAGFTVYDWPVRMRLDFVQNVAADEDGFAGRGDLVIGDSFRRPGLEAGIAHQRVQREAVLAAFADDDWWFRSRMRGTGVWLGYGFNESLRVRLAGFSERLDVASERNYRGLVDFEWFF